MNTITRRDILKAGAFFTLSRTLGIGDSADAGDELCYMPATPLATAFPVASIPTRPISLRLFFTSHKSRITSHASLTSSSAIRRT